MSPAMCRRQPFLTSMRVPLLLQVTQLSESQRVSLRDFCTQLLVRVNPNAGAQSTSFPNTVVRGVQSTLLAVGTVPSRHLVHAKPWLSSLLARPAGQSSQPFRMLLICRPASQDSHLPKRASTYSALSQALQAVRSLLTTVPFSQAAQRFPSGDIFIAPQDTLQRTDGE